MSYKKEYLDKLIEINKLIKINIEDLTTLQKVESYLKSIKSIGTFSSQNWNIEWRKQVYKFGEEFKEKNPDKIFNFINREIESSTNDSQIEVLEFIKSEVYLNFFTTDESIEYLLELNKRFNLNPEFKNSLSILYNQKGNDEFQCKYLKQALKIEKNNLDWLESIYQKEYAIGKELIFKKKHNEANKFILDIINSEFYKNYRSHEYQNFFIFLLQRNDDQLLIETKLSEINESSKGKIEDLFERSRIKIIEILGFFTAIIAFIFGAITITVKFELPSALILMSSFGLMMIIFVLMLSILFIDSKKKLLEDKRIWGLIIILLINISLFYLSKPLIEIIKSFV
jgi:hypothetical protein